MQRESERDATGGVGGRSAVERLPLAVRDIAAAGIPLGRRPSHFIPLNPGESHPKLMSARIPLWVQVRLASRGARYRPFARVPLDLPDGRARDPAGAGDSGAGDSLIAARTTLRACAT